jgi:NADPH-dependent curcumin reductase CurA
VGSAGDDKKIKYLKDELDFDGAFNYHTEKPADALPRLCQNGIGILPPPHSLSGIPAAHE